jgi:sulfate/thiosulfate transport system permease protein
MTAFGPHEHGAPGSAPAVGRAAETGELSPGRDTRRWPRHVLRYAVLFWLAALILVPVGSVVYRAFGSPSPFAAWDAISSTEAIHAMMATLVVAVVAVPVNAAFGVAVAIILSRHRFPGAALLGVVVDIPLAVSPVVVGVALLLVYGRQGWLGSFFIGHGFPIAFAVPGLIIGSAFISLPYVARSVLPVLNEIGTEQEEAASTLGAGAFTIFRRVTLPSIRYALAYGVTLTTARVLGEFGAVSVIGGNILGKTETLTIFVSNQYDVQNYAGAYSGAVVLCLISITVLVVLRISRAREERRSWQSISEESASDTEGLSLSTTSISTSVLVP